MPTRRTARPQSPAASSPLLFTPTRVFFVSGTGVHKEERVATQHAMREAGVADMNLVKVSSVIAPGCTIIPAEEGRALLKPGAMAFAVIATAQTAEPHQRIAVALAWAKPDKDGCPGYIAELEEDMARGMTADKATDEAGEDVVQIMAEKLRATVDAEKVWAKRGRAGRVRIGSTDVHVGSIAAEHTAPEEINDEKKTVAVFAAAIYL